MDLNNSDSTVAFIKSIKIKKCFTLNCIIYRSVDCDVVLFSIITGYIGHERIEMRLIWMNLHVGAILQ